MSMSRDMMPAHELRAALESAEAEVARLTEAVQTARREALLAASNAICKEPPCMYGGAERIHILELLQALAGTAPQQPECDKETP